MDKREFLEVLRQSLKGEVTSEVIEQNIRYYDQYIDAPSVEEEAKILSLLGDPRLIARTIIESDRAAKQKGKYTSSSQDGHTNYYDEEGDTGNHNEGSSNNSRNMFFTNFKWYHKVMIAIAILLVLILVVFIGRLLVGFLFAFGLPIILILLVMALFRKR
jgi:uncharacterized membrane protein